MNGIFSDEDQKLRQMKGGTITSFREPEFLPRSVTGSRTYYRELAAWLISQLRISYRQGGTPPRVDCVILCWKRNWNWKQDSKMFRQSLVSALSRIPGASAGTVLEIQGEPTLRYLLVRLEATVE